MTKWILLLSSAVAVISPAPSSAVEPPSIPTGYDAYRQWDRWPLQRIGVRAYMRSTYDRTGGNRRADASNFLYQTAGDFNVTLDVESSGIIYFARYNYWHGSPWHYEVDGVDNIVEETSTKDPNKPVNSSVFLPEQAFPSPLTYTWSTTNGADLSWVPVGFEKSFRMAYGRTKYGTGYYIYHQYVPGTPLSQPVRAWNPNQTPPADVLEFLSKAGSDLVPRANTEEGTRLGIQEESGSIAVTAKQTTPLIRLDKAPSMVRAIHFSVPRSQAIDFGKARLRVTWDDRIMPSVEAPLALFFGTGTFYNRDDREYLVKALPVYVRFDEKRVSMACFFPMPFFRSAKFEIVGADKSVDDVQWRISYADCKEPAEHLAYFHATYTDHPKPAVGHDLVLLDTEKSEGSREWSGSLVGTSFIFSHDSNLVTLEGDPRFFFDDSRTPQAQGTGTEEWGGGGNYWGGKTMTLALAGHPVGSPRKGPKKGDGSAESKIESAYRFLLADLMPFGRNALICLEHGGINQSQEHYETVTYWYGAPYATLAKTDELTIANSQSEQDHRYDSPDASEPYEITSRYELGPDQLPMHHKETFAPETRLGRKTTGVSEFSLAIDPKNVGVMLRRTLDYSYPNQRAEVSIAEDDDSPDSKPLKWESAGTWYLAGSNTCVYSYPPKELDKAVHEVITSNRRLRDDEFLLPRMLTDGHSRIRVRVKFTPINRPLFPGHPMPELAWTEIRYSAYCYVMPDHDAGGIKRPFRGTVAP